ncbi:MAG TPA: hypothetical protein VHS28_00405 [Chloroflexota bacterium]|nr:hypothetical protein [Chloroflexota bacterium]
MKLRSHALRPLAIVLAVVALAFALPSGAEAATRPHYDMQVSLDFGQASLDTVQKTSFRNNTGVGLPSIVFQVTPAYFDGFSLEGASVDGQDVAASMDGTVLELTLNSPLASGTSAEVELRYRVTVPAEGGRFGRGEGILALGNWFPILSVYQDGWDRHQYVDVGDAFFTEVADFDVTVTSDVPVKIAASGPSSGQDGNSQSFHGEALRDFALAISDRFQLRTREVDGVELLAYGPNSSRLETYLDEATRTMRWYSANLSPIPTPPSPSRRCTPLPPWPLRRSTPP